ncbi:hypothetical protein ORF1102 [Cotesia plutellae polydnavirus]|nr:hypothetical protein ORF1102 [Cotesia plutellae polydnavirus]
MKCNKRLLVCLMFQMLLIISEAGRNSKPNGRKSPFLGLGFGTRGTSPGRSNSGRVSPTQTNVGGHHVWGASQPNRAPVQPAPVGARPWANSQPPATLPLNRPQASGSSPWFRFRAPGTSSRPDSSAPLFRPQNPLNPGSLRHQPPIHAGSFRPQSPVHAGTFRPQSPVHSGPFRPPPPINSWSSLPSIDDAQSSTRNHFPALGTPKFTHADAVKRGSEILKSSSSSSISSGSSGYNSGSGRSSISSLGSFSSGSSSSWNRPQPIGLNVVKSTAATKSRASPQSCVDNIKTMPKIIAPAENCFDYFKLAVAWSPGFAYKERKKGLHIRDRIHASWFIHGLWPTMFGRYQDPMPGCQRSDITFNKNRFVDNKILGPLENTWYTILAKGWSDNTKFWEHEFYKHGSCASRSSVIGDDVNYFKRTLELFNQLNIGVTLSQNGHRVGTTVNLGNIINSIEDRIGATIHFDLVTNDMKRNNNYRRAFYVVQFTELPFEGIDDYVCVPYTWLIRYNTIDQRAVVSYPKDEDPFNTRDRVKRKEKCNDEWRFYMASVKYKSDSYSDAEYWIATKNDYGALVEEELKTIDTEPNFPLNKKLRIANRNHSSKLNDNPRKPLPRISIKRPALPELNKQLDGKRMKLDDAAQSSSAVLTNVNAEPGSSRQEQSIIAQDNQPMESTQTGTTASDSNGIASSSQQKDENLQESLPIQEQLESSIPSIDVDTPILVMDDDDEAQPTSIEEQQVPSNQVTSQFTEQPEPIREPQILVVPSREMTSNNQRSQEDILNNEPTSHQLRNSPKISAQLYHQMNEARRLIPTQKPVKKKIRPINIARNLAIAEQNPLMDQTGSLLTRSVPDQQRYHTSSYQNQYLPTNQNNLEQDLPKKSAASNNYEQRSNLQAISMSTPSIGQNSIIPSNPFYQTSEFPQQRQSRPTQQDSQQQPQKPKIRIGISIKSKNNRREPVIQGVTKKAPPPILTKVLNSIREALSTTHNKYLLNKQQFQGNHTERAPVNENHPSEIDNTLRTDELMEEVTPSAHHGANSDSDTVTDHEVMSDHEMSADEAPIERTNNFYGTGTTSGSSCADRPIAAQYSTNHQTHSKVVLEQQMLDNFAELFTQMGSTLRYTCDMYNTLRSSIIDTAKTYKKLLGAVEEFNSTQNSTGNESFSINLKPGVRQSPEGRHTEVTANTSSSTQYQQSNDIVNKPPKEKHNSWRFVLPPEYDPHDTRWTLKYQTNLPGLVELMPQSGVYISYGDLIYCQQVSKDCKSLALRLLSAIFNRKALSVCLSMTERAQASDDVRSNIRPELDDHACSVLLNFVVEHGLQRGWNTDLQPILSILHSKIQEIRFRYGVMVEC